MLVAMYVLLFALPAITSSCFRPPPPRPTTTTIKPPGNCKCGVARGSNSRKTRGRIVGGEDAKKNEFPWQVALSMSSSAGSLFCGGSLLSSNTVLTAAHCINAGQEFKISNKLVRTRRYFNAYSFFPIFFTLHAQSCNI